MPRRNQSRRNLSRRGNTAPALPSEAPAATGWTRTESDVDGEWRVRTIAGAQARKTYRCPGCDHEIRPGTPHVVAWPADDAGQGNPADERRHWHSPCWAARLRRRPGGRRG